MNILDELRQIAEEHGKAIEQRFTSVTRPRLAQLMTDSVLVQARKASGQDTTTAEVALTASLANLTLRERQEIQGAAYDLIFRFALRLLGAAASAG